MSDRGLPRLHTTTVGEDGNPVVFLHGLFGQGRNWTTIARALAEDHHVLLPDLPDHGRSEWSDRLGYPAMAEAVAATLEADRPGTAWSVVGHSMGGKVAMALALRRPDLVARLVVVDIAPVVYDGISNFGDYVRAMRAVPLDRLQQRGEAEAVLEPLVPDPVIRGFLLQNLRRESGPNGVRWRWQHNLALLGDRLTDLWQWPDALAHAAPYPGPVLWVAGAESDYVRPAYAEAMRALFPAVRTVTVKHAGHWVHSEQPAVFTGIVRQFLETPASPTAASAT
ncbi:pimeloyl-ACP methyl ester carboxylesterase [Friedmanniella endophytica]|uniref:Pimeloyl-ACP methyl ester carboxylesterase n=1 Tax=Microlunatus kandeliicorticis TaxID=1759536 RepID=A0A7W3IUI6_9ACTN|nr:alpha/beta fold hydrolase [Microlunatus kandeliicorticis]MBA8795527.1 pimeloyl-ACP methyl ester carboxylesterase [Microlunatus kandeliicorticis]